MFYLYALTSNKFNGIYVGQTVNVKNRFQKHKSSIKYCKKYPYTLMRKYIGSWEITLLETQITQEEIDEAEQFFIAYYRYISANVLNTSIGGQGKGGMYKRKHSLETKQRMSLTHKGKVITNEQRVSISETLKIHFRENPMPQDVRDKISKAHKGKSKPEFSVEHREKLRQVKLGTKKSPETIAKLKISMRNSSFVGHSIDEKTRRKISNTLKGQKQSEETKKKRVESRRKFLAKKKYPNCSRIELHPSCTLPSQTFQQLFFCQKTQICSLYTQECVLHKCHSFSLHQCEDANVCQPRV
jgi:hypothetical protein